MSAVGGVRRGEARRGASDGRKEKQKNELNEMRHSLFSEYYKVYRGREPGRWNNKGPSYALGALFIAGAFNGHNVIKRVARWSVSARIVRKKR